MYWGKSLKPTVQQIQTLGNEKNVHLVKAAFEKWQQRPDNAYTHTHTHTHGQTDRQTDRQTDTHTRTDRQTDTHTHGQTDRQTCFWSEDGLGAS